MEYFYIPRVCDFDFVAIINLRFYKGFLAVKVVRGLNLHPWSLFTVESLINFQVFYAHKIEIAKITKICSLTKIWVLNVNLGSEMSFDTS